MVCQDDIKNKVILSYRIKSNKFPLITRAEMEIRQNVNSFERHFFFFKLCVMMVYSGLVIPTILKAGFEFLVVYRIVYKQSGIHHSYEEVLFFPLD